MSEEKEDLIDLKDASNSTLSSVINQEKQEDAQKIPPKRRANDSQRLDGFLGPMLVEVEKAIATGMKELDKLEDKSIDMIVKNLEDIIKSTSETEENEIDQSQRKNHEYLKNKLNKTSEIIKDKLDSIAIVPAKTEVEISDLKHETTEINFGNERLPKMNNLTCLAHSLSAYLVTTYSRRDHDKLKNLTIKIYDAVNLWLSRLFRFNDSSVFFHEQEPDGLIRMCNVILNYKFPDYQKNGYQAINKPPAIYISAASKYSLPEYKELISIQLNLPLTSIKTAEVSKANNHTLDKIDIPLLIKQIQQDYKDGHIPVAIVANAGSYNTGQCDDLQQLSLITTTYKMWLHLEGVYLPTLILYSVPTSIQPVTSGDSITINFGELIGTPSLSYVTLYKNRKDTNLYLQPFNNIKSTLYKSLPYWCILQSIGHEGVIKRIKNVTDMSYYVNDILGVYKPYIKLLNFKCPKQQETTTKKFSFSELFVKALTFLTFVDLNNPIIIFKCDKTFIKDRISFFTEGKEPENRELPKTQEKKKKENLSIKEKLWEDMKIEYTQADFVKMMKDDDYFEDNKPEDLIESNLEEDSEFDEEINEYTDTLTTWLCDILNSLHKNIEFDLFEIENEGICIRYSPMVHANVYGTNKYDLHMLNKSLEDIIGILDASIKCKSTFDKKINQFSNLKAVNVPKWAGIGAIRYIPKHLLDKYDDIAKYLDYLNANNLELNLSTSFLDEVLTEKSQPGEVLPKEIIEESNVEISLKNENSGKFYDLETKKTLSKYISEINDINEELVNNLQTQDGAFSIDFASDKMKAIKLGMVNDTEAVQKLAEQVHDVGKNIEESSKYLEQMTEIVRIAIEKANDDLKKENETKLMQQGVMRQIPYVSGFFNWIAPQEKTSPIGRSLNLQSGKIETTEVIHKNLIQFKEIEETDNQNEEINKESNMEMNENESSERKNSSSSTNSKNSNFIIKSEEMVEKTIFPDQNNNTLS